MRRLLVPLAIIAVAAAAAIGALAGTSPATAPHHSTPRSSTPTGIHKIQHVVIIMQENRSFDSYFGTYPGADGIPGLAGNPGPQPCNPDPVYGGCVRPYHDTHNLNWGGPHGNINAIGDENSGAMNGFVQQSEFGQSCNPASANPNCSPCRYDATKCDVMGYHTRADIPNYWSYADDYVLQDRMYEPNLSSSQPAHLYMVSEWSAYCKNTLDAATCKNAVQKPNSVQGHSTDTVTLYPWTDLTYLLHKQAVSWRYYVLQGTEPDCELDTAIVCKPKLQQQITQGIWNPLPHFATVHDDNQLGNIQSLSNFYPAARTGTLPAVTWIIPNGNVSEHPPAKIAAGQTYVTGLINAIMSGPDWNNTAIFLSWDDWGGFYDHRNPPVVDALGYGLRVPGLVISPYAKQGFVDHQILSHDAYVKFIEDDFLEGKRLDPATDGRPDPRPDVRENQALLGDLTADFDFTQAPRPPHVLPVCPATDLTPAPRC